MIYANAPKRGYASIRGSGCSLIDVGVFGDFVCDGGFSRVWWTGIAKNMSRVGLGGRWLGIGTGSELECAQRVEGVTMSVGDLQVIR